MPEVVKAHGFTPTARVSVDTPTVYICVLNYGRPQETLQCLESLKTLDYPAVHVVVIDNASPDNSVSILKPAIEAYQHEGLSIHLIMSDANTGYSGGNNKGIEYALAQGADYVWLLNNDTTVDPHALTHMVEEGEKTGGLVGSLILYPDRSYQQVGTQFNWWTGGVSGIPETQLQNGMSVQSLSGASLMIPAKVIRRLGLFNESYFLYFEDGDYCLRAKEKNCPITVSIRARVYHTEGATTGKQSPTTQYYYHRNRLMLFSKFASPVEFFSILAYSGFRLVRSWLKGVLGTPAQKLSARIHALAFLDFCRRQTGPCPHTF